MLRLALGAAIPAALFYVLLGCGLRVQPSEDASLSHARWAENFISNANVIQTGYSLAFLGTVGVSILLVGAMAGRRLDSPAAMEMWQKAGTTRRSRLTVLVTMWIIIGGSTAVLTLGMFGGALAGSAVARLIAGLPGSGWLDIVTILKAVVGGVLTWYVAIAYLSVVTAFALWAGSWQIGIVAGWLALFGEIIGGELLQRSGSTAARYLFVLPYHNAMAVLAANGTVEDLVVKRRELLPPPLQGGLVLTCYAALAMALTLLHYLRFNLPYIPLPAIGEQAVDEDAGDQPITDPHPDPSPQGRPPAPPGT